MSRKQEFADALAGRIRVRIPNHEYSRTHAANELNRLGVPIDWRRGPHEGLSVEHGKLEIFNPIFARNDGVMDIGWELVWTP